MLFTRRSSEMRTNNKIVSLRFVFVALFLFCGFTAVKGAITSNIKVHHIEEDNVVKQTPLEEVSHRGFKLKRDDTSNCSGSDDSFPTDLFTFEQLQHGAIILHFIGGVYSFTLLAVVCNDYFIPAVECICEDLSLSPDVAAATFMSVATSSPELFVNVISTFITKSDLGIGTIAGSAMFNALGVGAIGGLAAIHPIPIRQWPVTRESIIYCINVSVLVVMTWDGRIEWYEALILICLFFMYFIFMFNNKKIIGFLAGLILGKNSAAVKHVMDIDDTEDYYSARVSIVLSKRRSTRASNAFDKEKTGSIAENIEVVVEEEEETKPGKSLWRFPKEKSTANKVWYIYTWPLKLLLTCVIPSPKTYRKLYPFAFIMCIVCIGVNSYFVSWMITTIGSTIGVPDTIMGMTFLAFGGCLPEACSIFIMSRRGLGGMGISNSLGANSLAILYSLGLPWFIKNMVLLAEGEDAYIKIESSGIEYIILSLILAIICLYIVLSFGKFVLRKVVGACSLTVYFIFIIMAVLMASGTFFEVTQCG